MIIPFLRKSWILLLLAGYSYAEKCPTPSVTTASGTSVNKDEVFCPGDLIFTDNFDTLDFQKWQHENTLAGGGNWEFQWFTNNRSNSYVSNGKLMIRPTLTADVLGEDFLSKGRLNIQGGSPADECTNPSFWGCERVGTRENILNPIRSARLRSVHSFSFKYGKLQVRAKLPAGDWLWPAIWLLPRHNAYGSWPSSGEIDLFESRGNRDFIKQGVNIGTEQIASTLHFGPFPALNDYKSAHFEYNSPPGRGFDKNFHLYEMEWTPKYVRFTVDGTEVGNVSIGGGFWNLGNFNKFENIDNPWWDGEPAAPFDQEFYIIMSLAVGGITYFSDTAQNPSPKPWKNNSPRALTDFWEARDEWLPTWHLYNKSNTDSALQVDFIRVYAI